MNRLIDSEVTMAAGMDCALRYLNLPLLVFAASEWLIHFALRELQENVCEHLLKLSIHWHFIPITYA